MPRSNSGLTLNEITELAKECNRVNLRGQNVIEFLKKKGFSDPIEKWYDIRRWMKSNAPSFYANIPLALRIEIKPESYKKEENMREPTTLSPRKPGDYAPNIERVPVQNKDGSISTVKLYGSNGNPAENSEAEPTTATPAPITQETVKLEGFEPVAPKKRGRKPGTKIQKIKDTPVAKVNIEKRSMTLKITELRSEKFTYCQRPGKDNVNHVSIQTNDGFVNSHDTLDLKKDALITLRDELTEVIDTFFGEE